MHSNGKASAEIELAPIAKVELPPQRRHIDSIN